MSYPAEVKARAIRLYAESTPMIEISIACQGASEHSIRKWVRAAGREVRGMGTKRSYSVYALCAAYTLPGGTVASAARAVGCSYATAHYNIKGRPDS